MVKTTLEDGVFKQWVRCASIRPGEADHEEAQRLLAEFDAAWRAPDRFISVPDGDGGFRDAGMMRAHGYQVATGRGNDKSFRRHMLNQIFARPLGPMGDASYWSSWGTPRSKRRLRRMIQALTFQLMQPHVRYKRNATPTRRWREDREYLSACLEALETG